MLVVKLNVAQMLSNSWSPESRTFMYNWSLKECHSSIAMFQDFDINIKSNLNYHKFVSAVHM